ncbi:unnamed protein product [Cuscuta europaea]|uniref:Homeodomain-like superfamily protein n=1 Tax=Cuscuta europaea TaxID=41803 RepID=A0A9P0YGI1_CUSEU|nr:unnamed protein product [Cuscuta europaea]
MEIRRMIDKSNKRKKCFVSEEDTSTLLERYTATSVLALLQEVAQVPDVKIDWNALVKKTTTGITNAREYQLLWRHLAYRHGLVDRLDDSALPLDDDSDLEYELEASPAVTSEASAEAAACVKVFIASGMPSESCLSNGTTVEAPLTISIPIAQACSRNPSDISCQSISMQGTNIIIPVSVQVQPLPNVTTAEGLDTNGSLNTNLPPRRKRKPWSEAEDLELIAAVQKCGEGNWANILKGDFKGDRTASQLSQRWAIIRKRQGTTVGNNSSQLSEAQLAARRAMSLALDMPIGDSLKAACSISSGSNAANGKHPAAAANGKPPAATANGKPPAQQEPAIVAQKPGMVVIQKPRVLSKPTTPSPDSMVKAAAVAAGARIATPSDAASLLKAAQSKNAVRIMPSGGGTQLVKPSGPNALPSNVHFIRTGLLSHSKTMPNATRTGKPAYLPVGQTNSATSTTVSGPKTSAEVSNGINPKNVEDSAITTSNVVPNGSSSTRVAVIDSKTVGDSLIPALGNVTEKPIEEIRALNHCNGSEDKNKAVSASSSISGTASVCVQEKRIDTSSRSDDNDGKQGEVECKSTVENHVGENQTADVNQKHTSPSMDVDEKVVT